MKHLLLTTIAAVLLVGCATTQQPEPPTAEAPDISIREAARDGNIGSVKQHIAAGTDVNAKNDRGMTPLDWAIKQIFQTRHSPAVQQRHTETAALLRKHGGKTAEELKAEGK